MTASTTRPKQIMLARHLIAIGHDLVGSRTTTLSREAIAEFRAETLEASKALIADDTPRLIRSEAVALVELMADLTWARSDKDRQRENRLQTLIAQLVVCLQADVLDAQRQAAGGLS